MRSRAWATAGLLALALTTPAVAGCSVDKTSSSKPDAAAPASSAPPSAQEELAASVKVFNDTPYHFTAADGEGMTVAGDVRPTDKAIRMTLKQHISGAGLMTMKFLIIDPEYYLKISVPGVTLPGTENAHGRWLHVDPKKMGGMDQGLGRLGSSGDESGDPFDATTMVRSAADVQKVDDTHYKGTLDLTDADGMTIDSDLVKALGANARSIPFTATVDEEHRLTGMKVTLPAVTGHKARVTSVTYSGFGQSTEVTKPTADQTVEAPEKLYQIFNG